MSLRNLLSAGAVALTAALAPAPAKAYPIDCAILLCLAGGFPASAECTAAKIEFIRRITPFPIEPPLQLWRCPMRVDPNLAATIGFTERLGRDGLTPDVRRYRDAIEIYNIGGYQRRQNNDGDVLISDPTTVGFYDEDGRFHWRSASYERGPEWLANAVGGQRVAVTECIGWHDDRGCVQERITGYENRAGGFGFGFLRGIAIRYQDYAGQHHTDFIRY